MKVETTPHITLDDKKVSVAELPYEIRKQIEVLDEMRQKQQDMVFELEIVTLAIFAKTSQITARVKDWVAATSPKESRSDEVKT